MAWSDVKLTPFKEIIKRQPPAIPGEPFHMQPYSNDLPKLVGNPWYGAYSKHGFWYKFRYAKKMDYDYIAARSVESKNNFLLYASYDLCINNGTTYLIAENQRNEIIGCVSKTVADGQLILGSYYVDENYRHSGIGLSLIKEVMNDATQRYVFHSPSHLSNKVYEKIGLRPLGNDWAFQRVILFKAENVVQQTSPDIKSGKDVICTQSARHLFSFDSHICGYNREEYLKSLIKHDSVQSAVHYDTNNEVIGFCVAIEVERQEAKQIWVGPWYAADSITAENLLRHILGLFEDYTEVHILLPKRNAEALPIVSKLADKKGKFEIERIYFQTCASDGSMAGDTSKVFGTGDLNSQLL
ncbi:hypothetical protein QR680_002694 [Steinernema hermaphroditum]|uniref:N-acetyltransferase domain-containing protein n=1 Tax=Steinernema hermaphroditum TaxID=289476 RepID=A0AA39LI69_9BILA|nr:hypothetical protein QR680_002694 [Steinernema hermaphroditum]